MDDLLNLMDSALGQERPAPAAETAETTNTQAGEHVSPTLDRHQFKPEVVCKNCQNALWHVVHAGKREQLRVFCRLMFSLIDEKMLSCDGNPGPTSGTE